MSGKGTMLGKAHTGPEYSQDTDWETFRRETAQAVLPTLIATANEGFDEQSVNLDYWAGRAVEWADALIRKLKPEDPEK